MENSVMTIISTGWPLRIGVVSENDLSYAGKATPVYQTPS